ncbi:MAG: recombinase A [Spirochaetales bacterium]|nr:recombinase A [Spirochaetales bacterium]
MGVLQSSKVVKARALLEKSHVDLEQFSLGNLVGRITELSAAPSAPVLSFISLIIREAQAHEEPVVWISACESVFFPPDFDANGVDLDALPVVWAPDLKTAVRAAEHVLRSNAFGLVVLDLHPHAIIDQGRLGKLARFADLHRVAFLFIAQQEKAVSFSLGSIISLRFHSYRSALGENAFQCVLEACKDKKTAPGWEFSERFYGPDGLC